MSANRYFCRAQHEMFRDDEHGGWVLVHDYEKLEARVKALEDLVRHVIARTSNAPRAHVGDHYIRSPQIGEAEVDRWQAVLDARA